MAITNQQYIEWLNDSSSVKIVLLEVGVLSNGVEITRYFSTRPYVTGPNDTPANTVYLPIITQSIAFTESLSLSTGSGALSSGTIELANYNGTYDFYLNDVFDNRTCKAWIGDPRFPRDDFKMIFNGITATIGSSDRDTLNLTLTDKLQKLNNPITDQLLGGPGPNATNPMPLSFGQVFNCAPPLYDPVNLTYKMHDTSVAEIREGRDTALPVSITKNESTATFSLNQQNYGDITTSVRGDNAAGYNYTIATIIRRIVTGYGLATSRFTTDDIDEDNFTAFDAAHGQSVGIYCGNAENTLETCNQLANSVGAQVVMSRLGKLRIIQVDVPGVGIPTVIGPTQMVEKSLYISDRPLVSGAFLLAYNKNWYVQQNLLVNTGLPPTNRALFVRDWPTTTQTDPTVQVRYKLNSSPAQIDTMLLTKVDADAEAARRLALWGIPRTVFKFTGTAALLGTLELGNAVTLVNNRFGLSAGKTGMVLSLSPNWMSGQVEVEVLI